jgi:hypothetical protein
LINPLGLNDEEHQSTARNESPDKGVESDTSADRETIHCLEKRSQLHLFKNIQKKIRIGIIVNKIILNSLISDNQYTIF